MARMTRARVKQEHVDLDEVPQTVPPYHPPSRAVTISSTTTTPAAEPAEPQPASSGDTTVADDTEMSGTNGVATNGAVSNGVYANGTNMADTNGANSGGVPAPPSVSDPMQTLGQHSRQLIQVIQSLERLCISSTLPSLPKFVIVGDQSAGKSSIIEAVCDISLPRSEGTCTRCPFQITTTAASSPNAGWTCKVNLIYRYFYDKKSRGGKTGYERWNEQQLNAVPFAITHDKSQLDAILRRAQLALLNPSQNPDMYARPFPSVDSTREVGFSPNVVSLEIEAPGLPEISLFDLPGAINRHEDENEQHLVGFIERLMKNYLMDEKALILLACAANSDVETSTAFRFIGECKAIGRCMGVLTKPDLLVRQRYPTMRRILNGEKFRVGNSWFMTKQLSQEELDADGIVTHAEARQRERDFFGGEPWATQFSDFADRFGIPNVQNAISQKLTAHIIQDLPEIVARVNDRLDEVTAQLATFPAEPIHAAHTVMDEMQEVVKMITVNVRGQSESEGNDSLFRDGYKQLLRGMRAKLKDLRPEVVMRTPGYVPPPIDLDSEEDDRGSVAPTPMQTPSKMRKGNDGQAIRTPHQRARAPTETPRTHVRSEHPTSGKAEFRLDEVKDRFDRGSNSDLPDQVNPKVTEWLIKQSIAGWRDVTKALVNSIQDLLMDALGDVVQEALSKRLQTKLFAAVTASIHNFVSDLWERNRTSVMHLVDCELHRPITYASTELSKLIATEKAGLERDRLIERVDEHYDTLAATTKAKVPSKPDRAKKLDELKTQIRPDNYSREVSALATPLAYYKLAADRLLDSIAIHLEHDLMWPLETELQGKLRSDLKVTDEAHCAQLLAEDPQRELQRARYVAEQQKLKTALAELQGLPQRVAS